MSEQSWHQKKYYYFNVYEFLERLIHAFVVKLSDSRTSNPVSPVFPGPRSQASRRLWRREWLTVRHVL